MQKQGTENNPFRFIKVRGLVGWSILGLILALVLFGADDTGNLFQQVAPPAFLTLWPLLWILWKFRRRKVRIPEIMGGMPARRTWLSWMVTVAVLLGLSIGSVYLLWYPLSYVAPSVVERLILSGSTFFTDEGIPKPVGFVIAKFFLGVVLAPVVEELCFRGIILHRWSQKWSPRDGVILSSLLFGLIHTNLIGAVIFGFVMSVLYIKTRSLWVPIFCHVVNNAVAYAIGIIGYVSGNPGEATIEDFRSGLWLGVVCLVLTIPWAVWYLARNWPGVDWRMPYSPEPEVVPDRPQYVHRASGNW